MKLKNSFKSDYKRQDFLKLYNEYIKSNSYVHYLYFLKNILITNNKLFKDIVKTLPRRYYSKYYYKRNLKQLQEIKQNNHNDYDYFVYKIRAKRKISSYNVGWHDENYLANYKDYSWKKTHKCRKQWMKNI